MVFPCPELSMCIRHLFQFMFVVQLYLVSVVSGSWCLVVYDFRCFVSWWWCTMVKTIRDTWKQSKPISLDHHSTLGHLVWGKKKHSNASNFDSQQILDVCFWKPGDTKFHFYPCQVLGLLWKSSLQMLDKEFNPQMLEGWSPVVVITLGWTSCQDLPGL